MSKEFVCPICGSRLIERYGETGSYYLVCSEDSTHDITYRYVPYESEEEEDNKEEKED